MAKHLWYWYLPLRWGLNLPSWCHPVCCSRAELNKKGFKSLYLPSNKHPQPSGKNIALLYCFGQVFANLVCSWHLPFPSVIKSLEYMKRIFSPQIVKHRHYWHSWNWREQSQYKISVMLPVLLETALCLDVSLSLSLRPDLSHSPRSQAWDLPKGLWGENELQLHSSVSFSPFRPFFLHHFNFYEEPYFPFSLSLC